VIDADLIWSLLVLVVRELTLFAAIGILIGSLDDIAIDMLWMVRSIWRQSVIYTRHRRVTAQTLSPPIRPGRIAVYVPAWDESAVIRRMVENAFATFQHQDYRIYVGAYPNDAATLAELALVTDPRLRVVVNPRPGPTTKADCLNRIWAAMREDEAVSGVPIKAIVLHDAEDVVHSMELRVFDRLIERYELVQLPVLPLIDRDSRWVSAHYVDEFVEAHSKVLVVREAIGAGVPSAGVGCAIATRVLAGIAAGKGEEAGGPFDADSLTEDYELGLRLREFGGRGVFVRMPAGRGRGLVAVRAYFPGTMRDAIRQKSRWMVGIALSGWDRLGWRGGLAEAWMRLRDRAALLVATVLAAAYLSLALWTVLIVWGHLSGRALPELWPHLVTLLAINVAFTIWRCALRAVLVARSYGVGEGLRSIPRIVVANCIAMLASWRALFRYVAMRRAGRVEWDKTAHAFPSSLPPE